MELMKKLLLSVLYALFFCTQLFASDGQMVYDTTRYQRQTGGGGSSGGFVLPDPTFWAPLNDVNAPLKLYRGTGPVSSTRTTSATYVHPVTGLVTTATDNQLRIEGYGALFEGQRTNFLLWSRALSDGEMQAITQ